jgi:hypothetical protein
LIYTAHLILLCSAISLKKIGSGTHSDPNYGWRAGGVSYINIKRRRFWNAVLACALLRKNFWNGVPACSITKIPLLLG